MLNYIKFIGIISTLVLLNFIFAMNFPMLFFIALGVNIYVNRTNSDNNYFSLYYEGLTIVDIMNILFLLSFLNFLIILYIFMFYQTPIMMSIFVFIYICNDYCKY